MPNFLGRLFGDPHERERRRLQPIVERVNTLEPQYRLLGDAELRAKTDEFKARLARRETLDAILPDAFAAVREATRRVLDKRHYDVQIMAGIVLHEGKIAEMKTGEGKTQVAALPLYLNALAGQGCHLVTPNDYLSRLGGGWMGPIYHLLGVSVAVIIPYFSGLYDPGFEDPNPHGDDRLNHWRPISRREAYEADITYGTNNEFGFDYLRDNLAATVEQRSQRPLHYAIVDEVDNILIDEARTPLIISAPAEESAETYYRLAEIMRSVREEEDYTIDERTQAVSFTDEGIDRIEQALGIDNLYAEANFWLARIADAALKAQVLKRRDRDYVVRGNEVIIVDEFTGRMMQGRRWSEGLHQAIEAKEGLPIQPENRTQATITFQNYFRMYDKLAGMTGTAVTEAEEFAKIYGLDVVVIPTHRPMVRKDNADLVFKTEQAKFEAVVREIEELHAERRPVLVGTVSIEKSEQLAKLLERRQVPHHVLNAKFHEQEAEIVAEAGQPGAVTIATNMAGRGTDIVLGPGVKELGGLHIIGTERHESRRIDNQLRGRAGRQGDPGSSRFYVSLDDDLMRRFGSDRIAGIMNMLKMAEDEAIEHPMVSRAIESAQTKVEGYNFDIRKHVVEYDNVMNEHRAFIYADRDRVLRGENMRDYLLTLIERHLTTLVDQRLQGTFSEEWDLEGLLAEVGEVMPLLEDAGVEHLASMSREEVLEYLVAAAQAAYDQREALIGEMLEQSREQLRDYVLATAQRQLAAAVERHAGQGAGEEDWQALLDDVGRTLPLPNSVTAEGLRELGREGALAALMAALAEQFEVQPAAFGSVLMRDLERYVVLRTVDTLWIEHLTAMDDLREGIGLRAFGQRDPLVEYKREAHEQFERLVAAINSQIVHTIYKVGLVVAPPPPPAQELHTNREEEAATPPQRRSPAAPRSAARPAAAKVGRNDACPCGSGKKYKHCHGATVDGAANGSASAPSGDGRATAGVNGAAGRGPAAPHQDGRAAGTVRRPPRSRRRG